LEQLITTGSLQISSAPSGAAWYLDGAYAGMTPDNLAEVAPGSHQLTVKKKGYKEWEKSLTIRVGEAAQLTARLAVAGPRPGAIFTEPATGMEFVWVSGGCFQMGQSQAEKAQLIKTDKAWYEKFALDELPRHKVCVDGFWMGKNEATVGQWRRFIKATGYQTDAQRDAGGIKGSSVFHKKDDGSWGWGWVAGRDWDDPGFAQLADHPVTCVSYNDVEKFIAWLNRESLGKYRLPTEAEWEYACRANSTTIRFWGDDADQACAYANVGDQTRCPEGLGFSNKHECRDGYFYPAPVGEFKANAFGLDDMLGNVWEWCSDWYAKDYYKSSPAQNPKGPATGSYRVFRGGGWSGSSQDVRSANRVRFRPSNRINFLGFRLVSPGRR